MLTVCYMRCVKYEENVGVVAQGYMAAMDLGLEARYKDVRTS